MSKAPNKEYDFIIRECQKCKHPLYADTYDGPFTCPKCEPVKFQLENPDIQIEDIPTYNNTTNTDAF